MKKGMMLLLAGVALSLTGCLGKVTENKPGSMPAYRDRVEARYQKPVEQVYEAAKRALNSFGHVSSEGQVYVSTNQVRTLEGAINEQAIYIRIEAIDPRVTSALVQVRTKWGSTDLRTANDLVQRIGVELN